MTILPPIRVLTHSDQVTLEWVFASVPNGYGSN